MPREERLILAIDGGGTKTDAVLARFVDNAAPEVIARSQAGPSNPTSHGKSALNELAQAISDVADQANVPPNGFSIALLALAGVADDSLRQWVLDWADGTDRLAEETFVITDAELVLAVAEGSASGVQTSIGIIAGTGSVAFGRGSQDEEILRVGGWGPLLGDDGGGFWIAREALRHVLAELDSGSPPSPLQKRILQGISAESARELVSHLHEDQHPAQQIASFAAVVEEAAQAGDAAAREILATAANRLVTHIHTLGRRIGASGSAISLACGGSLLTCQTILAESFVDGVRESGIEDIYFVEDPVLAAVQIAAALV